jgi:hypothetical protein
MALFVLEIIKDKQFYFLPFSSYFVMGSKLYNLLLCKLQSCELSKSVFYLQTLLGLMFTQVGSDLTRKH